jgi:hypothetical protein
MNKVTVLFFLLSSRSLAQPGLITFNDDGAWCWFQDERALIHNGQLVVGSVAAGTDDPSRKGDIEATVFDLTEGRRVIIELHDGLTELGGAYDDHNTPAFLALPDGRLLAVYSRHGPDPYFYYRLTKPSSGSTQWTDTRSFVTSPSTELTYSNLHLLLKENGGTGRLYNFFRGLDGTIKPSYAFSDDWAENWTTGNIIIEVPGGQLHRPYVKYASNGVDTIHFLFTEGHPHVYPNSVYHVFYRDGLLHQSDGTVIRALSEGLNRPEEGTLVFRGNEGRRAWTSDIHLDEEGKPYVAFSVRIDPEQLPLGTGGLDHRYFYARWTGAEWEQQEIAFGGSCLYWWQDDYTGNIALDPDSPETVYISTDADPSNGTPLKSEADGGRHFEIYRGDNREGGSWGWVAVTSNSRVDNIRPIVPKWDRENTALLWLRGDYRTYTNYDLEIVGLITKQHADLGLVP